MTAITWESSQERFRHLMRFSLDEECWEGLFSFDLWVWSENLFPFSMGPVFLPHCVVPYWPVWHFFQVKLPVFALLFLDSKHIMQCWSLSLGWVWCMPVSILNDPSYFSQDPALHRCWDLHNFAPNAHAMEAGAFWAISAVLYSTRIWWRATPKTGGSASRQQHQYM